MPLASLDDVNAHLPQDRAPLGEGQDKFLQIAAERTVRGYLSDVFAPLTLAGWNEPASTPELIREAAGRLIAAMWYRQRLSAEVADDVPEYAQRLYDEAIGTLEAIRAGIMILPEVDPNEQISSNLTAAMFYPSDPNTAPPKFTMDLEL